MAGNKNAIIAQALVDTDIHLKVTLESISSQKAAMIAVHGLNWEKEWNQYRASIMKRYYNLLEKRHVLTLLRDNPGRFEVEENGKDSVRSTLVRWKN